jgi:hypothetical protein
MFVADNQLIRTLCLAALLFLTGVAPAAGAGDSAAAPPAHDKMFDNRIMELLNPPPKLEVATPPPVVERWDTPIFGSPEVTKQQIVDYIRRRNPAPRLTCPLEELIELYYEEAGAESIRPDLALSQAILETGFFRYGGDVVPEQNNYSGLGTTGYGERGVWFPTPRLGVRAHVQHLLAYATTREPVMPLADPRYDIIRDMPSHFGQCYTWESLNGKWAIPGHNYGQRIVKILNDIKNDR